MTSQSLPRACIVFICTPIPFLMLAHLDRGDRPGEAGPVPPAGRPSHPPAPKRTCVRYRSRQPRASPVWQVLSFTMSSSVVTSARLPAKTSYANGRPSGVTTNPMQTCLQSSRFPEAADHLREAVRLNPAEAQARAALEQALTQLRMRPLRP